MKAIDTLASPRWHFPFLLTVMVVVVAVGTALGAGVRATYGASTTADEPQYLLSALSLWEDGNLDVSDELAAGSYREFHELDLPPQTRPLSDGSHVSPHDPLLPFLLALPMGLWGWMGAKAALAVMAGALAGLLVWIAHRRLGVRPGVGAAVVGLFAMSPPLAIYATQVYPELPAAVAVAAAIAALTGRRRRGAMWLAVGSIVALPWLAVKYVPVAALLAIAALWWAPRRSRGWIVASLVGAGVAYVVVHLAIYEGLTPYAAGDHFVGGEFTAVGTQADLWGRSSRLLGLLVDQGFGLAAWQPAYLLLPVALTGLLSRRPGGSHLLIALAGTGWLVATFVALTMHGWWFPGRQLVVILPAVVLLVAVWADTSTPRLATTAVLGLGGVGAFAVLLVEGLAGDLTWVVDFGSTSYPLYRWFHPLLPDYMDPSPATWIRHGAWLVGLAGLVVAGLRASVGRAIPGGSPVLQRERQPI